VLTLLAQDSGDQDVGEDGYGHQEILSPLHRKLTPTGRRCGSGAATGDVERTAADTMFGGFRTKDPQDFLGPTDGFTETPGGAIPALQLHATGRLSWT